MHNFVRVLLRETQSLVGWSRTDSGGVRALRISLSFPPLLSLNNHRCHLDDCCRACLECMVKPGQAFRRDAI